jgi:hypothetical protein
VSRLFARFSSSSSSSSLFSQLIFDTCLDLWDQHFFFLFKQTNCVVISLLYPIRSHLDLSKQKNKQTPWSTFRQNFPLFFCLCFKSLLSFVLSFARQWIYLYIYIYVCVCVYRMRKCFFLFPLRILFSLRACVFNSMRYLHTH